MPSWQHDLERQAARAAEESRAVAGLAARLVTLEDPQAIAQAVAETAAATLGVAAAVLLADEQRDRLELAGVGGQRAPLAELDDGELLKRLRSGEPRVQLCGAVCFPMTRGEEVQGALAVARSGAEARDLAELAVAATLAQLGALGLARARAARGAHALLRRLVTAQEEERRRLASELHDDAIQALTAGLLDLSLLQRQAVPAEAACLQRAKDSFEHALQAARALLFDLRPPALETAGLEPAIRQQLDKVAERTGCAATLDWQVVPRLDPVVESIVFRTTQEALTNVPKHARPRRVAVSGRLEGTVLTVRVRDDGVGFDLDQARETLPRLSHLGLRFMAERVELAGGVFQLTTRPGAGTEVAFWVPLRGDGAAPPA